MPLSTSSQYQYMETSRISASRRLLQRMHIDLPLLLGVLFLAGMGLLVLYSAADQNIDTVWRQSLRLGIAFIGMIVIAQIPPNSIRYWAPWLFGIGLALLLAVLLLGEVGKGAQRWLNVGLFRFQPSEIMKIAVPLMLAWYLADHPLPPMHRHLWFALLMLIVPTILVAKQPDLGTALLIACAGALVLFLAGLRWQLIAGLVVLISAATPFIWNMLHDYQRSRVLTFLNPENDPLGAGYHIIQSTIAIGSGGMYGKGWLNGTQSHLDFLPERSTDFIFAVYSEEFGLIGVLVLLALYFFIVARGLVIAVQAQDTFSRLLAGSLTLTFLIYVIVNLGMVTGMLPVVGVPLPLISYGGTSVVTLMAAFGILMSIQTHRKLIST